MLSAATAGSGSSSSSSGGNAGEVRARPVLFQPAPTPLLYPRLQQQHPMLARSVELRCAALDPVALLVAVVAVCGIVWEMPHPADEVVAGAWVALNTAGFGAQLVWARGDVGLLWARGAALATSVYVLRGLFALDQHAPAKADAGTIVRATAAMLVQFLPVVYASQRRAAADKLMELKLREERTAREHQLLMRESGREAQDEDPDGALSFARSLRYAMPTLASAAAELDADLEGEPELARAAQEFAAQSHAAAAAAAGEP